MSGNTSATVDVESFFFLVGYSYGSRACAYLHIINQSTLLSCFILELVAASRHNDSLIFKVIFNMCKVLFHPVGVYREQHIAAP